MVSSNGLLHHTHQWIKHCKCTAPNSVSQYFSSHVLVVHVSYTVSILGFENCQSFFSATAHVRCTAPARPTQRSRCRSAAYFIGKTTLRSSYQPTMYASNCMKNTILSLFYIKLVVYYNKRSWKSRGIANLKRNP